MSATPPQSSPPPPELPVTADRPALEPVRSRRALGVRLWLALMFSAIGILAGTTVDGAPAPIYPANHAFRAIPVAAGSHVVELTYDSAWLRIGLIVTIATALGVLGLAAAAAWATLRPGRRPPGEVTNA